MRIAMKATEKTPTVDEAPKQIIVVVATREEKKLKS
jgi:hypothetical protein